MQSAVIFDLDGTLLDSLGDLARSCNDALSALGHATHPVDAYKKFVGDGIVKLIERALPHDRQEDHTECHRLMKENYAAGWSRETKAYEGIEALLGELKKRGVILGVLSNKPDPFTQEMIRHYFGDGLFEVVLGATDRFPPKPDPQSAVHVGKKLGLSADETWYLGDTDTDMKTANGAGFHAVGVTWGFREEDELRACGARHIIHAPGELLSLMEE